MNSARNSGGIRTPPFSADTVPTKSPGFEEIKIDERTANEPSADDQTPELRPSSPNQVLDGKGEIRNINSSRDVQSIH